MASHNLMDTLNFTYAFDYDGYTSKNDPHSTTLLVSNLLLGIVAGVITGMCLCCMCVCLMYSKHKKQIIASEQTFRRRRVRLSQRARDLVSALRDRDSQPPATPPPPNYTLVSGLPSYDEALKEARMISKEDENHDYVIWIEKVERQRKISEEHLPTVFHIFNQSQQEETISEETTANQSAAEHVATVIETPNEYCTAHI